MKNLTQRLDALEKAVSGQSESDAQPVWIYHTPDGRRFVNGMEMPPDWKAPTNAYELTAFLRQGGLQEWLLD